MANWLNSNGIVSQNLVSVSFFEQDDKPHALIFYRGEAGEQAAETFSVTYFRDSTHDGAIAQAMKFANEKVDSDHIFLPHFHDKAVGVTILTQQGATERDAGAGCSCTIF